MFEPEIGNPMCPKCNNNARVDVSDGVTVIYCGRCGLEFPLPIKGHAKHDQRERLEETLKRTTSF